MLRVRVMPTLLYKDLGLVKGVGFDSWRRVGSLMQAIKVYNMRDVDELVFLDITASLHDRGPDFHLVDDFADECFMPLTVGGGIRSVDDVRRLLAVGADKVAVNSAAVTRPELIRELSQTFGAQCVVVSLDARRHPDGEYEIFTHAGTRPAGRTPMDFARQAEDLGAGEMLVTSIERDGTMRGYDVDLIRQVVEAVGIPVIASGGAGNYDHMLEALRRGGASAVAAASIFHFTHQTPREAKQHLASGGVSVRL